MTDRATELWIAWGIEKAQQHARDHATGPRRDDSTPTAHRPTHATTARQNARDTIHANTEDTK